MGKLNIVPAAFDPKQANIKEVSNSSENETSDESELDREYAGRIEDASERFRMPLYSEDDEDEEYFHEDKTG
jgi:hypothetical protein